jgi:hypothetical protein
MNGPIGTKTEGEPLAAQQDVVQEVANLFAKALEEPIGDLTITPEAAEASVQWRLARLSVFTGPESPPDVSSAYQQASKLTSASHEFCKLFPSMIDEIRDLKQYSEANLLAIGKFNLDKNRMDISDQVKSIQRDTFLALDNEIKNSSGRSINSLVSDYCSSEYERSIALMEATLLVGYKDHLMAVRDFLLAASGLCGICRNLLYRAIIERQGNVLASKASKQAFEESLDEVPWEVLSHVLGPIVGPIKVIAKTLLTLADKEGQVDNIADALAGHYRMTMDFIDAYRLALAEWDNWAMELKGALLHMMKREMPKFSSDLAS